MTGWQVRCRIFDPCAPALAVLLPYSHLMSIDWRFVRVVSPNDSAVAPSAPRSLSLQKEDEVRGGVDIHKACPDRLWGVRWDREDSKGTLLAASEGTGPLPRQASVPHVRVALHNRAHRVRYILVTQGHAALSQAPKQTTCSIDDFNKLA